MIINESYVESGQLEAAELRSRFAHDDMKYAAYNAWQGLTDYVSDEERAVAQWMTDTKAAYREYSENMEWKYPAARPFCEQKGFIEQTDLYRVFCEMPKCSLLHIHNAAALSTDSYIGLLKEWAEESRQNRRLWPIYIVVRPGGRKIVGSLLYHPDDALAPFCEPLSDFFRKPDAESAFKNLVSFSSPDRAENVPYIWDEFNRIFIRMGDLFEHSEFFYRYHYRSFMEMIMDRIEYAELRCSFTVFKDMPNSIQGFVPWNLYNAQVPFLDYFQKAASDAVAGWNGSHPEDQREFHARVILSARRDLDILDDIARLWGEDFANGQQGRDSEADRLLLKMDSAIVIKQNPAYKSLIEGFDLVSEEDRGKKTYTLLSRGLYQNVGEGYGNPVYVVEGADMVKDHPEMSRLRIQMIDFYLHDGESAWADNDNVMDAAIFSPHRIGHGFNLSKFPALIETLYPRAEAGKGQEAREPFLEICPISNQMLRYYPDLRLHSMYELMKNGVQCVLGNDDPTILGNPGLSYDFWEAFVGIGIGWKGIKGLVFNAYICECLADGGYPVVSGSNSYVLNTLQCVETFNEKHWIPFVQRAHGYLRGRGLV